MSTAADRDQRILSVVMALGPGEVTTYGDVAFTAGFPGRARLVGRLLAHSGDHGDHGDHGELPWWRVVTATGRLVPGHEAEQVALLHAEGVTTANSNVVAAPIGRFSPRRGRTARSRP